MTVRSYHLFANRYGFEKMTHRPHLEIAAQIHSQDVADLNRESLYRTLSLRGNPRFFNLLSVLDAVGLELSIHQKIKNKRKFI